MWVGNVKLLIINLPFTVSDSAVDVYLAILCGVAGGICMISPAFRNRVTI